MPKIIALSELEFERMLRANEHIARVEAEVELTVLKARMRVGPAKAAHDAMIAELAKAYDFDPLIKEFDYDVRARTLIIPDQKQEQPE